MRGEPLEFYPEPKAELWAWSSRCRRYRVARIRQTYDDPATRTKVHADYFEVWHRRTAGPPAEPWGLIRTKLPTYQAALDWARAHLDTLPRLEA